MQAVQQKIEQLRKQIEDANYRYYVLDDPNLSDVKYDHLLRELEKLELENPEFINTNSPSQRIGYQVQSTFTKIKHALPMLSLSNAFSDEEVANFFERITKTVPESQLVFSC